MRILYLGDIVGEKTLPIVKKAIDELKSEYKINIVLVNAENVTKGKGLIQKHYKELKTMGVHGISMGNHTFSKSEIKEYIDEATICRPANLNTNIGKPYIYIQYNDKKIALVNMLGRVFQNTPLDCPFKKMDNLLKEIDADYVIVDFHGEATSEKKAFFYEYANKVDAILGTHTHCQTSDEQIYNNCLYITDIGMCGPFESVLGDSKEMVIERFKTGVFEPLSVAETNEYIINGVVLDFNPLGNKIIRINKKMKA